MADNAARTLKYARLLAFAHIFTGALLFVLGIVDRVHGYFWSGEGCFGIWCGIWMCITGSLGIPASNRERTGTSNAMAGTFMGFSITSAVFGGIIIICYSVAIAHYRHYYGYFWYPYYGSSYDSEMAVTAIILVLGIIEFVIGIWAAILCCFIGSCDCCGTQPHQPASVTYMTGQGMVPAGGYVMGQGPGGVPVAIPMQQAGGVVTLAGAHPQVVQMPATGMPGVAQVVAQPQAYQMSSAQGAVGGHPQMVHVPPSGGQVGMGTTGQIGMGATGTQTQAPLPYSANEQIPVKT